MKNKIINNLPFVISFLVLLFLASMFTISVIEDYNAIKVSETQKKELCQQGYQPEYAAYCESIMKLNTDPDFLTIFSTTILEKLNSTNYVFIICMLIPALIYICKVFKYNQMTNQITRNGYFNVIKKLFFHSYKSIFLLPLVIVGVLLICIFYVGTIEIQYSLTSDYFMWQPSTISHPIIFILMYIINLFVHSILYVNISLCIARKHHNLFVAVILSLLTIIGIEAIMEIVIGAIIFSVIFHSDLGMIFNIINFFSFNDVFGFGICMIVPFVLMVISFVVLYLLYKNKEQLIIDCESNESEGEKA